MSRYVTENIFCSPAQTLVNTVNCVGVMGKGIAKVFKEVYPQMFRDYQRLCDEKKFTIGKLWVYPTLNKLILNFPTKTDWRHPARYDYLEKGLSHFAETYTRYGINSISFPQLGCGNGELEWEKVRALMEKHLSPLPIDIFIHIREDDESSVPERLDKKFIQWLRESPKDMPFETFWEDMVEVARQHRTLQSTYSHDKFELPIPKTDALLYSSGNNSVVEIRKEYLYELWVSFKYYGFLSAEIFSDLLMPHYAFLMSLITTLRYVKPIKVSKAESELGTPDSRALRLETESLNSSAIQQFELSF